MKSIKEIRRECLRRLVDGYPSQRQFAEAVGLSPAQLNQLLGGYREMGDSVARRIESALGLVPFFFDKAQDIPDEPESGVPLEQLLPSDQLKLLTDYQKVSTRHQEMLREMGDAMARKSESASIKLSGMTDPNANAATGFSNVQPGPEISRHVPLISWVQAGHWNEVCDVLPLEEVTEWIPALARVGPRAFALRIQGDSMEPKFTVGAAIVVEPDVHAQNGDYVIVRLDGTDECTFKQLVEDAGKRFLKPLNPRYPLMEITSKASVVGIARGMWLSLQT